LDNVLIETLAIAQDLVRSEKLAPQLRKTPPADIVEKLDLSLVGVGKSQKAVLQLLRKVVECTPQTSNRRFFNQLFAGRIPLATAADMLASMLNVSMYTYKVAGPNVLLENELLDKLTDLAGFHDGDGLFLPGGSLANLVSMVLGRNQAAPGIRDHGMGSKPMTVYLSAEGHYSIPKNAGLIGMGRKNVRSIPVDAQGRMRVDLLQSEIERDLSLGKLPSVVVATSGTTVRGAFDPIHLIAPICRQFGLWLHVDGAVGATMLLHPEHRKLLQGIEQADSLTWDAHKMMGVPMSCSALLVRNPQVLAQNFEETANYLFQADPDRLNPGIRSILCGRRNDALKLWAAWQWFGDEGWKQRLDRQFELALYLAEQIEAHAELELCETPPSLTVCFHLPEVSSAALCEQLHIQGDAVVGFGDCAGTQAIRMVLASPDLTYADLDLFLDDVMKAAAKLT
jgi:glutamate/tyrosine decarboxylase-like PLP-dependent enzyme